ncbi:MAG TPA: DUF4268 domain-containing protein [Bacteroidales bacterium]|nr:DUF4268 domain-containing protein [Bacteroidales bacterium]
MFTKEEKKAINKAFWDGFKTYCHKKKIKRKWLLSKISIKHTQLKFYADHNKALVLFQIDNKSDEKRLEVFSYFKAMRKLWDEEAGEGLMWSERFNGIDDNEVSAIYFQLDGVNIYNKEDHNKIYDFFVKKMTILEDIYLEYGEVLADQIFQLG